MSNLLKKKKFRYYILLVISLIIGGFINWSAFYLALALSYHQLIINQNLRDRKIFILMPLSGLIFAIHLLHVHLLKAEAGSVFGNVLERVNPYITADLYEFSFFKYIKQELLLLRVYYTCLYF